MLGRLRGGGRGLFARVRISLLESAVLLELHNPDEFFHHVSPSGNRRFQLLV